MSSTLNGQVLSEKLGGHVLVDSLRAHGVEMVFGVPGESYLAVLDGCKTLIVYKPSYAVRRVAPR